MYEKYKIIIFFAAIIAGFASVTIAYSLGIIPFLIVILMSAAGLCYKAPIVNIPKLTKGAQPLSSIPGSKAFIIAGAWGFICTFLPVFASHSFSFSKIHSAFIVFLFTSSMVFFRTACIDILAIQGNKIAGEITIPVLLGEKRTSMILKILLCCVITLLFFFSYAGIISAFGYFLIFYPASALIFMITNQHKEILPLFFSDIITESMFLIAGLLGFIWSLLSLL